MNIKSLLLGSAAAVVAASTAQAADAVIVEPEPVEYVRVCDAYGSGFFFIPGTETCLKFGGYVRSVFRHTETTETVAGVATVSSTEDWVNRARMQVDARSETDWGTLRGFFRLDTDIRGSGSDAATLDRAMVTLAGFRLGQGANYWTTNHGFAGIDLSGIVGEDGPYFGSTTAATMFDYTWAADGLAITAGVQYTSGGAGDVNAVAAGANPYDYYVGMNYSADFGTIAATYIVDQDGGATGDDGDAWKVSATLDLSEFVPGGTLHAMYMDAGDDLVEHVQAGSFGVNTESMWNVGFDMNLSDDVVLAATYYEYEGNAVVGNGEGDLWAVGLNWRPAAAPGLKVYATYFDREDTDNATATTTETDGWALEVRRSF